MNKSKGWLKCISAHNQSIFDYTKRQHSSYSAASARHPLWPPSWKYDFILKTDTVNRLVFTWRTIMPRLPNFIPIPSETTEPYSFYEQHRPDNKKHKNAIWDQFLMQNWHPYFRIEMQNFYTHDSRRTLNRRLDYIRETPTYSSSPWPRDLDLWPFYFASLPGLQGATMSRCP